MTANIRWTLHVALAGALAAATVTARADLPRPLEPIAADAAPRDGAGYIAASFGQVNGGEYAFVLQGGDGRERRVRFLSGSTEEEKLAILEVAPGTYRVTGWTSPPRWGEELEKNALPWQHSMGRPFEVQAGHVVFLGSFGALRKTKEDRRGSHDEWVIMPRPVPGTEVLAIVRREAPAFAMAPVECLLCATGLGGGAPPAALPLPRKDAMAVLHYHRPDGDYAGVTLWAWEGFQGWRELKDADRDHPRATFRSVDGFTRDHPAAPTGQDVRCRVVHPPGRVPQRAGQLRAPQGRPAAGGRGPPLLDPLRLGRGVRERRRRLRLPVAQGGGEVVGEIAVASSR